MPMRRTVNWLARKRNRSFFRQLFCNGDLLLFAAILALSVILSSTVVFVITHHAADFGFFDVPVASWFVLGLVGFLLSVEGLAIFWRWKLAQARKSLVALQKQAVDLPHILTVDDTPLVTGFQHLSRPEFLVIVQTMFRAPPPVKFVALSPLSGGYSGSNTLLAELTYKQNSVLLLRWYVLKLGPQFDILSEREKFDRYVREPLGRAARLTHYAKLNDVAGIAYQVAGLGLGDSVQSFAQLYRQQPPQSAATFINEIFLPLEQAWYQHGQIERVDPRHEYQLLLKKRSVILAQAARLDPPANAHRSAHWCNPVDFLQNWPDLTSLPLALHRATVHGDLNARNILFETGGQIGQPLPWFIDFSHTGNGLSSERAAAAARDHIVLPDDRGHTLRDFCRLEADVKFILTTLEDDRHLKLALEFEQELLLAGVSLPEQPPSALAAARFEKAWGVVRAIRHRAAAYLVDQADLRPYDWALLQATLPIVYYHSGQFAGTACEYRQKQYAFIAAGMLCNRLTAGSPRLESFQHR